MNGKTSLLMLLLLPASCASYSPDLHKESNELRSVVIASRSSFPPYTGFIRTWVVYGADRDGVREEFLYPYFREDKSLPVEGDVCNIFFHVEAVSGQAGGEIVNDLKSNVIDKLKCSKDR